MQHAGKKILLNKEVEEIHNENVAKLESMTQEEILEEQARIKASLGELFFHAKCKENKFSPLSFRQALTRNRSRM